MLPVVYLWEKPHGLNEHKLSFQALQHLAPSAREQGPRMKVMSMCTDIQWLAHRDSLSGPIPCTYEAGKPREKNGTQQVKLLRVFASF